MGLSKDARTGMLAMFCILVIGYGITYSTSIYQQKNRGTEYHIIFNRVEGIEEGTKVYYNGRLVGRVRNLAVQFSDTNPPLPQRADVTIGITGRDVVLTHESSYKIDGGVVWGAKWINIQYEKGTPIPPKGTIWNGESVTSFNHRLRHGTQGLEQLHDIIAGYKKQIGSGEEARKKIKEQIKYWNYMAFDLRVQANKFNQFSGLIVQQLDKMVDSVDQRIVAFRARGQMAVSQIQLAAHAMQTTAIQRDTQTRVMVSRLQGQIAGVQRAMLGLGRYVLTGDKLVVSLLDSARKRVKEAQERVELLRLFTKNPELAKYYRELAGKMRMSAAELKKTVENLKKRVPKTGGASKPYGVPDTLPTGTDVQGPPVPGVPQPPLPTQTPSSSAPAPTASPAPTEAPAAPESPGPEPTGHQ